MARICKALLAVSLAAGLGWSLLPASRSHSQDFKRTDPVDTIEVKLEVGAGDDLEEPVALDLGLGFPLWLHPVGRKADDVLPFGAVPQQTTAEAKVAACTSATFTCAVKKGDDGQDGLQPTPHLLAGLRVGDIARVGFSSPANNNWNLAGYEIKINGKVFASGKPKDDQPGKAKDAHAAAQKQLTELEGQIAP